MNRAKFYAALRAQPSGMFGRTLSQKTVPGIEGILEAFITHGDGDARTLAYALSITRGEVGIDMLPVREGFAKTDAGARRAVNNLARRRGPNSAVAKYARPTGPYGHVYYGRAQMQLTWLDNYRGSSADAGVDLVKDPDAMLDPVISARVLIRGLMDGRWNGRRKGIRYYLDQGDLKNARRTVNITDKWEMFADFYQGFLAAIEAAGGVPIQDAPPMPTDGETNEPSIDLPSTPETPSQPPQSGFFVALMKLIGRLFK